MIKILPGLLLSFFLTAHPIQAQFSPPFSFNPSSLQLQQGDSTTVELKISTSSPITGADLVLEYNSNLFDVNLAEFPASPTFPHNFHTINTSNPSASRITISSSYSTPDTSYTGTSTFTTLHLTAKQTGTTSLKFICTPGSTTDTNLAEFLTGNDIANCNNTRSLPVTITSPSNQSTSPPPAPDLDCTAPNPPTDFQALAVDTDTILLQWARPTGVSNFSLYFGTQSNNFQYGAANIGNTNQLLVNYLVPNTPYYFALTATNDCTSSNLAYTNGRTLALPPGATPDPQAPPPRYLPTNQTTPPDPTLLTSPDQTAIYQPQISLSPSQLAAIPSLDNLLQTKDSPLFLAPNHPTDESPPSLLSTFQPQILIVIISLAILVPGLLFFLLHHRKKSDLYV